MANEEKEIRQVRLSITLDPKDDKDAEQLKNQLEAFAKKLDFTGFRTRPEMTIDDIGKQPKDHGGTGTPAAKEIK